MKRPAPAQAIKRRREQRQWSAALRRSADDFSAVIEPTGTTTVLGFRLPVFEIDIDAIYRRRPDLVSPTTTGEQP